MNTTERPNMVLVLGGRNQQHSSSQEQESNDNNNPQHAMMMMMIQEAGDKSCRSKNRHDKGMADGADAGSDDDDDADTLITAPSSSSSDSLDSNSNNNSTSTSGHDHAHHYADLIPVLDHDFTASAAAAAKGAAQTPEMTTTSAAASVEHVVQEEASSTAATMIPRRRQQPARRRRLELLAKAQASASRNKGHLIHNNNSSQGGGRNSPPPSTTSDREKTNGCNDGDDNNDSGAKTNTDVVAADYCGASSSTSLNNNNAMETTQQTALAPVTACPPTPVTAVLRSLNDDVTVPEKDDEKAVYQEAATTGGVAASVRRVLPLQQEGKPSSSSSSISSNNNSSSLSPATLIPSMTQDGSDRLLLLAVSDSGQQPLPTPIQCPYLESSSNTLGGADHDDDETRDTKNADTAAAAVDTSSVVMTTLEQRESSVRSLSNNYRVGTMVPPPTSTTRPRRVTFPVYPHFGNSIFSTTPTTTTNSSRKLLPSSGAVVMHRTVPLLPSSPPVDRPQFVVMSSRNINNINNNNPLNIIHSTANDNGHGDNNETGQDYVKKETGDHDNNPEEKKQAIVTRYVPRHLNHRRRNLRRPFSSPQQNSSSSVVTSTASAESKTVTTTTTPETAVTEAATRLEKEPESSTISTSNQTKNIAVSNATDAHVGDDQEKTLVVGATVQSDCASSGPESTDPVVNAVHIAAVVATPCSNGTEQEQKASASASESTISQALMSYHGTRLRKMLHQEDQACVQSMSEQYNHKLMQVLETKGFVNADTPQGTVNEDMVDNITARVSNPTLDTSSMEKDENDDDLTTLVAEITKKKIYVDTKEVKCETANWAKALTKDMTKDISTATTAADGPFNATHGMRHSDDHDDKKRGKSTSPSSEYTAATFATLTSSSSYYSLSTSPMALSSSLSVDSELADHDGHWGNIVDSLNDMATIESGISCDHVVSDSPQPMETPREDNEDNTPFVHQQDQTEKKEQHASQGEQYEAQSPIVNESLEAEGLTLETTNATEETEVTIQQALILGHGPVASTESERVDTTADDSDISDHAKSEPESKSDTFAAFDTHAENEEPIQTDNEPKTVKAAEENAAIGAAKVENEPLVGASSTVTGADTLAVSTLDESSNALMVVDKVKYSDINAPEAKNRKNTAEEAPEKPESSQNAMGRHPSMAISVTPSLDISTEECKSKSARMTDEQYQHQAERTMDNSKNTLVEQQQHYDVENIQHNSSTEQQKPKVEHQEPTCHPILQINDEDSNLIKARKALIAELFENRNKTSVEQQQQDDSENRTGSSVVQAAQQAKNELNAEISNPDSTHQQQQFKEEGQEPTCPTVLQLKGRDSSLMEARKALIADLANFHNVEKRTAEPSPRHVPEEVKEICTETMAEAPDNNVVSTSITAKETEDNRTAPLDNTEIATIVESRQQTAQLPVVAPTTAATEDGMSKVPANQTTQAEIPTSNAAQDTHSLERKQEHRKYSVAAKEPMRAAAVSKSPRAASKSPRARTMEFKPIAELIRKDIWSKDPAVVEWALQLITIEAFADPDARALIARLGGLLAIVGAMETHASMYRVQIAGCQALEKLALDDENEKAIAHVGGVDAVLAALMGHANNAAVQEAAWAALTSMTSDFVETDMAIDTIGGFAALLTFMKRHDNHAAIQGNACRALASLCQGNETRLKALVAADGIVTVAATLQAHWNDPGARREASNALAALCSPK